MLLLIGWDGLSTVEAAALLGCATGAFAVRLHRARRRLQRALDPPAWARHPPVRPVRPTALVTDLTAPRVPALEES